MPLVDFRDLVNDCVLENSLCVFGEDAQYRYKSGGAQSIRLIFDNVFEQVDPDTETIIASNQPVAGIKLADLKKSPEKGDCIVMQKRAPEKGRQTFRIVDSQEDGHGGAALLLHKVTGA